MRGASLRDVEGRFGLSRSSLHRHHQRHVPETIHRAYERTEIDRGLTLIDEVEELALVNKHILYKALDAGDLRIALAAVRQLTGVLNLLAKSTAASKSNPPAPIFAIPFNDVPKLSIDDVMTILPEDQVFELPPDRTGVEEEDDDFGARFSSAQKQAGRRRRRLLGGDKRSARKGQFRTH